MTAPTLTDFLLARIAEDEKRALELHGFHCDTPPGVKLDTMGRPYGPVCGCDWNVGRVLAECAAKRAIVEGFTGSQDGEDGPWGGCGDDCEWKAVEWTIRYLATPYATHPDYRAEWGV